MAIKGGSGPDACHWKGGRIVDPRGYVRLKIHGHPRANGNGYVWEHIVVVETALGHPLPPRAEVHHFDENKSNNAHGNLVVCQDRAYHLLLHRRTLALAACGDPNARRCVYCSGYDRQCDMRLSVKRAVHPDCEASYRRNRRARLRAQRVA